VGLIVVDASVAVKWALREADSEAAAALLDDDDPLLAPELLRIEGASAITRAGRSGRVAVSDVEDVVARWLRSLEAGAVELWPDRADLARAVTLSCELRHPLPDCLYLALAERTDAELVTADATFVRRVSDSFPRVRLLAANA
jgi:predicted nucleic acid-binding protein